MGDATPTVDRDALKRAYRSEPVVGVRRAKERMLKLAARACERAGWSWEEFRAWIDDRVRLPHQQITAPRVYRVIRRDFQLT